MCELDCHFNTVTLPTEHNGRVSPSLVSSSVVSFLYKVGAIERLYLLVEVLLFFSFAESNLL